MQLPSTCWPTAPALRRFSPCPAPFREEYKAACVNLGRRVTFDLPDGGQGAGEAVDVDEEGRLVVRTDSGEVHVFTGEVSVHGIYGAV